LVDVVGERVFETLDTHRTVQADAPRRFEARAIGREERRGTHPAAVGLRHPVGVVAAPDRGQIGFP